MGNYRVTMVYVLTLDVDTEAIDAETALQNVEAEFYNKPLMDVVALVNDTNATLDADGCDAYVVELDS